MSTRAQWSCDPFLMDVSLRPEQRADALDVLTHHDALDLAAMLGLTGETA